MSQAKSYTHPDVLTTGVVEGWADPIADPALIDWAPRQARAAIPFQVVDGRPVNPCQQTGIRYGRNELGHWGEALAADAVVVGITAGGRWLAMVERTDGHGWALPGGHVDPGEDPAAAAVRELQEETGLTLPAGTVWETLPARYVPDPRASDEAWMVTVPSRATFHASELPTLTGADDAKRAMWLPAASYPELLRAVETTFHGTVFPAHRAMLAELLEG
ncbi:NUDIX domain-containing protein [Nonomuraea ceibae]|uniref:NUDIX domain-containing protein n=1 Tax=Nonomuraea ceibae TaxID=1935170 RepID=UPI001C5FD688|nr:NUDIX domain-containing protein [Nonomuraea ceibae]